MTLIAVRGVFDAFRRILLMEDRIAQLTESLKAAHVKLEDHAQRIARLEGKLELIEISLGARRRKLPE